MELMRHGSTALTLDRYAAADSKRKRELVEAVGELVQCEAEESGTHMVHTAPLAKAAGAENLDAATVYDAGDWWRRGELNPRPVMLQDGLLRT